MTRQTTGIFDALLRGKEGFLMTCQKVNFYAFLREKQVLS